MGTNFNYNKIILGGRLTANPELKQTTSGVPVTSFSIAVRRKMGAAGQQPETDFFNVTAWRGTAEFICRYFKKGSTICITGSLQNRSWTDAQGVKKYATDIVADEATFVDGRDESASADQLAIGNANAPTAQNFAGAAQPKFEEISTDDNLPF